MQTKEPTSYEDLYKRLHERVMQLEREAVNEVLDAADAGVLVVSVRWRCLSTVC